MFVILLTSIVSVSNHTKCIPLRNRKFMTQPTLINLHVSECSRELHYYPFAVNLDRCAESCNTLDDPSSRVCARNETEDLNVHVFNMITGISVLKTLIKHISCKFKCKFDCKKCNSN